MTMRSLTPAVSRHCPRSLTRSHPRLSHPTPEVIHPESPTHPAGQPPSYLSVQPVTAAAPPAPPPGYNFTSSLIITNVTPPALLLLLPCRHIGASRGRVAGSLAHKPRATHHQGARQPGHSGKPAWRKPLLLRSYSGFDTSVGTAGGSGMVRDDGGW